MKVVGFVGPSAAGKTTLIERLLPPLRSRGLRVSVLKHAHHGFDIDRPGKDSYRFREAGAGQVLIVSNGRWALLTETPQAPATLDSLLAEFHACDLVLVEGFKIEGDHPRIAVRRGVQWPPALDHNDPRLIALATEVPAVAGHGQAGGCPLPCLDLNDAAAIAAFLVDYLELPC